MEVDREPLGYARRRLLGHDLYLRGPVAAEVWFEENDPEGVAFEYEVLE